VSFNYHKVRSLISFRAGSYHARVDPDIFETVCAALLNQEEMRFTYTKLTDGFSASLGSELGSWPLALGSSAVRHGPPRHLACIDGTWYLFTDDLDQRAQRKFALSRMSDVLPTGQHFTPAYEFDIEQALAGAFGAHSSGPSTVSGKRSASIQKVQRCQMLRAYDISE
jgi:hypothetical protein